MNIIVTGGSGRIGRYVVAELVRHKHHVTSVDVKPLDIQGSRFVRADITDFDQIRQVLEGQEAVVHMGAWANWGMVSPSQTYGDNTQGTYNVFQACADLGVKRIVSASSNHVYGFGIGETPPVYVALDEKHSTATHKLLWFIENGRRTDGGIFCRQLWNGNIVVSYIGGESTGSP